MHFAKNFTAFLALVCALFTALPAGAHAAEPVPMRTAWLGEHETFLVWYAKEKGWDKEAGLDLTLVPFDTGKALIDGMDSAKWVIGGCGAMPALTASLDQKLYIMGIGNDESAANALYVRKDSPILQQRGHNLEYPDVLGNPDTVRGKVILTSRGSSAHYLVSRWLNVLGLTEKDVALRDMPPDEAIKAFEAGVGDALALWAPKTYTAERKGLVPVATSSQCNGRQPIVLVADFAFANQNPEQVAAFLKVFLRGVDMLRTTPHEKLVADYQRFYKSWTGLELSKEEVLRDLADHPVFTLSEQLAMFAPKKDATAPKGDVSGMLGGAASRPSSRFGEWLNGIVSFHIGEVGDIGRRDAARLERQNLVTDVFLKKVQ